LFSEFLIQLISVYNLTSLVMRILH